MSRLFPDTDTKAEEVQIELLRRASVAQRVALARGLSATAIRLARRAIRRANPAAGEREIDLLFVKHHYGDRLAESLRRQLNESPKLDLAYLRRWAAELGLTDLLEQALREAAE